MSTAIQKLLEGIPVIPVLALTNVDTAPALANALVDGGLPALEITLRTPQAMDVITAIKDACPCLLYTSPSPRDQRGSRMPSSA